MAQVDIVFGSVEGPDGRTYIEQKVRGMFRSAALQTRGSRSPRRVSSALSASLAAVLPVGRRRPPVLPLARRADLTRWTPAERRLMTRRIRCFTDLVDRRFPLLDGEFLEKDSDWATYLRRAWGPYPARTVVLRRRSNLATSYYVLPDTRYEPALRRITVMPLPPTGRALDLPTAAMPDFASLARKIAMALAGEAPSPYNKIGAFLIDQFWPSGSDAARDWRRVYQAIQEIVKNELAAKEVQMAAARIQGFVSFLANEYVELKKSPRRDLDELLRALQPYDTAFFMDIVDVFMFADKPTTGIAAASLANFLLGANLHIALNQERALVDKRYLDDPGGSPYAKTAGRLAKSYGDYATKALAGLVAARTAQVTGILRDSDTSCQGGPAAHCTTVYSFWFEDHNPKPIYKSKVYFYSTAEKHPDPAQQQATEARKKYLQALEKDLRTQVPAVVTYWNSIALNPIAVTLAAPATAPVLDPEAWTGTVPVRGSRTWKDGYKVRYAVSFYRGSIETPLGPWWSPAGAGADGYLAGSPKALPTLTAIPVDPFYLADGRCLYRQFAGSDAELVARIADNETTRYVDSKK